MKDFQGRVAVVTGAASGIGRALAHQLADRGCDLALVDVDADGLGATAAAVQERGRKASLHALDVSDRAAMEALPAAVLADHGRVHLVVNNAGVSVSATLEQTPIEDYEWIVGVNFWGVVYGCKFFLPHLLAQGEGHFVNLSSLFGLLGLPTQGSYNATKFAVRGLSESLWCELRGTGVGLTCVHPGGVRTAIVRSSRMADEQERAELVRAFERMGMPPERAAAKILRAVQRDAQRVRIGRETYAVDWLKRLLPGTTQRLVGWAWSRREGA